MLKTSSNNHIKDNSEKYMPLNIQLFAAGINGNSNYWYSRPSNAATITVYWSEDYTESENKSTFSVSCYLRRSSGTTTGTFSGTVYLYDANSNSLIGSAGFSQKRTWNTSDQSIFGWSISVPHNEDGTKNVKIYISMSQGGTSLAGNYYFERTPIALTTIPRGSVLNPIEDFLLATSTIIPISITKYVSTFSDTLRVYVGNTLIRTVSNILNGYNLSFTSSQISTIQSLFTTSTVELTFILTTVNGSTTIGTSTQLATATDLTRVNGFTRRKTPDGYQYGINTALDISLDNGLQVGGKTYVNGRRSDLFIGEWTVPADTSSYTISGLDALGDGEVYDIQITGLRTSVVGEILMITNDNANNWHSTFMYQRGTLGGNSGLNPIGYYLQGKQGAVIGYVNVAGTTAPLDADVVLLRTRHGSGENSHAWKVLSLSSVLDGGVQSTCYCAGYNYSIPNITSLTFQNINGGVIAPNTKIVIRRRA